MKPIHLKSYIWLLYNSIAALHAIICIPYRRTVQDKEEMFGKQAKKDVTNEKK